jgi:hypothetical protein
MSYKDDGIALIIKSQPQPIGFGFDQPHMAEAFKRYLMQIIASTPTRLKERQATIDRLQELLSRL